MYHIPTGDRNLALPKDRDAILSCSVVGPGTCASCATNAAHLTLGNQDGWTNATATTVEVQVRPGAVYLPMVLKNK